LCAPVRSSSFACAGPSLRAISRACSSTGEKASTLHPEDDENIREKLVEEGVEEADHDQRLSSERTSGK